MPVRMYELRWIPESVQNILAVNGIHTRSALARRIGLGSSTIYEVFDADWAGLATAKVLAQMAGHFNVPLAQLVLEPSAANVPPAKNSGNRKNGNRTNGGKR